jgi:hypothetical protein
MSAKKLPTSGAVCFRSENRWWSLTDSQNGLTSCMWKQTMIKVQSTCTCTLTIRQTANARQRKKLRYQAIKSKWTCWFKTDIHNYSFDARKKIWNENVQRKFCQESSNLPFAVPGNVKLKLPNIIWKTDICTSYTYDWYQASCHVMYS